MNFNLKQYLLVSLISTTTLISCKFNVTRTNNKDDINAANSVVDKYYSYLNDKDYPKIITIMGPTFLKNNNVEQFLKNIQTANVVLGKQNGKSLLNATSKITNEVGGCVLSYKVYYQNDSTKQDFVLEDSNGIFKIASMRITKL
ncbi:hypothetical protein [Pedobacter jeongneungensis]|uniref:hypothetical protein n=1 Tax=Pedobacter jeongneungensis TaxID=947309 RepID=UPI0004691EE6|nr:hypothetical protein [Pedobacter jeongneungensis]